jgi:filamentous hemagglutinin
VASKGEAKARIDLENLLKNGPTPTTDFYYAGTTEVKNAYGDAARAELGWLEKLSWTRDKSANELTYKDAKGVLRESYEQQGLANIGNPAIYGLSGPLGATVRIAAAANGVLQAGYGANQAINGDGWNAAGNILFGTLSIAGLGIPGAKPGVAVGAKGAASKNANATSMLTDSEAAALVERNVIEGTTKGAAPKVLAEGKVGGQTFQDVNQTSRPLNEADPKIPSLITDRIADKAATNPGKLYPNGNMKDAHAEIGVIQQAYSSGKTAGADMSMTVAGKDVCGFCKGDIAAAAERAELKSLTVRAIDDKTGLPKSYYWESGMKSIKEKK